MKLGLYALGPFSGFQGFDYFGQLVNGLIRFAPFHPRDQEWGATHSPGFAALRRQVGERRESALC